MTRSELRTRILNALDEDATAPVFITNAEVNTLIDESLEVLAEESEGFKKRFTIPRRAGTFIYQIEGIGNNIMTPYRIWLPDLNRRLEAKSLTNLDARHQTWMDVSGDPWCWAPVSWDAFAIWPIPVTGGGWMEVDCHVWPDAMIDDDDIPELPESEHEAIVLYAESEGLFKEWDVMRGMDVFGQFARRWGAAGTQASVEQMVSAIRARGEE